MTTEETRRLLSPGRSGATTSRYADPEHGGAPGGSSSPLARPPEHERQLDQLARMLDKMPQNPVAAADLEEVRWTPLFAQIGRNLLGILIFASMAGFFQMKFKPKHFLVALGAEVIIFTILVFLVTIILETLFADDSLGPKKYGSRLLRAIWGRKVVRLSNLFEVFAFTHSVNRGQGGNLRIDTVMVDDDSSQNRVLFIRNNEIQPGKFRLEYLLKGKSKERDQIVHNRKLDRSPVPCGWYDDELLKLRPEEHFPMYAVLNHREPLLNFMDHPVVNMCLSVMLTVWQLAPLGWWFSRLAKYQQEICGITGSATFPDWLESRETSCNSLLHFVQEVHEHYDVSDAEAISTAVLAFTTLCVVAVMREKLRFRYLQDMFFCFLRMPPGAINQLRGYLALFEEFLNPFLVVFRIRQMVWAWAQGLSALGRLPAMVRKRTANRALYETLKVVRTIAPQGDEVLSMELPFAVGERAQDKDAGGARQHLKSREEQDQIMMAKWAQWKVDYGLMRDTVRFKMMVMVPITCREALDLFTEHFLRGEPYARQLEEIFSRPQAQEAVHEGEKGVATHKHFTMGSICVPRGFSLTHVLVHPDEDEEPHQIVVGTAPKSLLATLKQHADRPYVSGKGEFFKLLQEGTTDEMVQSLQSDKGFGIYENFQHLNEDRFDIPQVVLPTAARVPLRMTYAKATSYGKPSASAKPSTYEKASSGHQVAPARPMYAKDKLWGAAQLREQFGNDVAYSISFVFQLTEAYHKSALECRHEEMSLDTGAGPRLTAGKPFQDYAFHSFGRTSYPECEQLRWQPKTPLDEERFQAVSHQTRNDARPCKRVIVVKERNSSLRRKFITIFLNIGLPWIACVLVSVLYGFFVPIYRWVQGDDAFPGILWIQMVWNSSNHAIFLLLFLYLFESETQRLSVISMALLDFERKTVTPPKTSSDATVLHDPFALFVNVDEEYRAEEASSSEVWRRRWTQVGINVENWDNCSMSMRVLVSTARLTSQVVLLLAALLLGSMLLLSVAQAVSGKGAVGVDNDAIAEQLKSQLKGLVKEGIHKGVAHMGEASRRLSEVDAVGRAAAAMAGAGGASAAGFTPAVLEELADCFRPFRRELREPLRMQLAALAEGPRRLEGMEGIVKDVDLAKATKAQALTMFFFVIIAVYAIRLVVHIANINDCVMKQESVLVEQKSNHRKLQTARELEGDGVAEPEEEEQAGGQDATPTGQTPTRGESAPMVAQPSMAQSVQQPQDAQQDVLVEALARDPAKKRYEKMLDTAIENARNNTARFPLRLFGFAIGYSTLVIWVCGLGANVIQQGKAIAVPAAHKVCDYLHSHPLELDGVKMAAEVEEASEQAWQFFIDSVCNPLVDEVADLAEAKLSAKVEEAKKKAEEAAPPPSAAAEDDSSGAAAAEDDSSGGAPSSAAADDDDSSGGRRLAGGVNASLPAAVGAWWARHAGVSAEAKLALLRGAVREHELEAHRLLLAAPSAVYDAAHLGRGAALDAALLHWGPEGRVGK